MSEPGAPQQVSEPATVLDGGDLEPTPGPVEQLFDPERPELAVGAAFAGGIVLAMFLRRLRS